MNRPRFSREARSIFTDDEDDVSLFDESGPAGDLANYLATRRVSTDDEDEEEPHLVEDCVSDQDTVLQQRHYAAGGGGRLRTKLFPRADSSDEEAGTAQREVERRPPGGGKRNPDGRGQNNEADESKENVADIYLELQHINDKMKREFKILHERDQVLKEKERGLTEAESAVAAAKASLEMTIEIEVKRRLHSKEEEYRAESERLDQVTREKAKQNKRLKDNFDTLKMANDTLRRELECLQSGHEKMEKQATSLQARLTNLQRKAEHDQRKENHDFLPPDLLKGKKHKETKSKTQTSKTCMNTYDVLGVLLEWVADVNLRPLITDQPTKPLDLLSSPAAVQEKCIKVLPSLVELVRDMPTSFPHLVLPTLQFIYWSLLHLDPTNQTSNTNKLSLTSTLRRLGEELYKSRLVRFAEDEGAAVGEGNPVLPFGGEKAREREGVFFRSPNVHIRLLSSLIILRALSQVDHVANVLEVLKTDLKTDTTKQLFLYYHGVNVITPYLRPTNKALMQGAVDVYLGMSMESPVLSSFLDACSTETWFRAVSMVMRMPNIDDKINEKLSILLQKLSKFKSNRRYFEVFGLTLTIQELHRAAASSNNAFLTLNLKSILFNLNVKVAVT